MPSRRRLVATLPVALARIGVFVGVDERLTPFETAAVIDAVDR